MNNNASTAPESCLGLVFGQELGEKQSANTSFHMIANRPRFMTIHSRRQCT